MIADRIISAFDDCFSVIFSSAVLGWWVSTQRKENKESTLSSDHKEKLSEIGFIWEIFERKSKHKRIVAVSSDEKYSGCGRANIMKCFCCSFPGFQKKICIKKCKSATICMLAQKKLPIGPKYGHKRRVQLLVS